MSVVSWIAGPVAAVLVIVGFAMLGRAGVQIYQTVRLDQPDPTRGGNLAAPGWTLMREFLGHTRMVK